MVRQYLLLFSIFCLAASASYAGITGILAGKVTDQEGKPVAGATVRVLGTTRGAITKLDGRYTVVNVNAGSYDVRVTAYGYDTVTKRVTIIADQTLSVNVTMNAGGLQMKVVDVSAEREMVRSTDIGSARATKGEDLVKIGRDNIASALSLSAGIRASGNNFVVRGGRTNETQVMVDGLTVTDQFTGGLGNVGSTISAAMPSPLATEQVVAQTGGFSAEYGNAVAGIVNTVVKTGRTDRYEGQLRWRKDVPFLFGSAGNGIQAGAPNEDVVDVTLGGPLGLGKSTFFVSVRNTFQLYRNAGLQVIDPIGNNWGLLPNNRTWARNITPRMRFQFDDNSALLVGGSYGMLAGELSSIGWLYAKDQGYKTDFFGNQVLDANGQPIGNGVYERMAKQPIVQEFTTNGFAQLNQTLGANTFFDIRASYNAKVTEVGKRKSFEAPGLFTGIELYQPVDNMSVDDIRYQLNDRNTILDEYDYLRQNSRSNDGFNPIERTKLNPITGYYEGTSDAQSTNNPFGLIGFFFNHGNTTSVEFRNAVFFQVDGNITHNLEVGDTRHVIKGGFEFRTFDLSLYSNGAPWSGDQFAQSYGRPNVTDQSRTRDARKPTSASMFVQDQIMLKGLVLTAGLRMDYLNANATTFDVGNPDSLTPDATTKLNFGPRVSVTYPITQRQNFQLSYGIYYQNPPWSNFFDGVYSDPRFQDFFGNTNLQPQRTNQFQVAYNHQLNDELALSFTGYYNDIQNQPSVRIDTFEGRPKYQYDLASYGTSRGIEMTFMKRLTNNWSFNINYTIANVRGNANSATQLPPVDPLTGDLQFPIVDFPLSNDLPQRINAVVGFAWGKDEGPTIAGIPILENLNVNVSGFWQSGLPYTPVNIRGQITGQLNSARFPSNWNSEMRLTRTIPLTNVLGGRTAVDLILDVENLFNYTGAVSFFAATRSPDQDGFNLNRRLSDLTSGVYYREADPANKASISDNQYDRYGNRYYQERVDFNKDGRVTPEETFRGYQEYVSMVIARRGNYQFPRRVFFAVSFRF
jgi:outer membrane receptor protein involved in Fe transport